MAVALPGPVSYPVLVTANSARQPPLTQMKLVPTPQLCPSRQASWLSVRASLTWALDGIGHWVCERPGASHRTVLGLGRQARRKPCAEKGEEGQEDPASRERLHPISPGWIGPVHLPPRHPESSNYSNTDTHIHLDFIMEGETHSSSEA